MLPFYIALCPASDLDSNLGAHRSDSGLGPQKAPWVVKTAPEGDSRFSEAQGFVMG